MLVCEGFDSPDKFLPARWPANGLYPAWDKAIHGSRDTTIKASGKSSLRLEILPNSAANTAGFWRQTFEHNFGPGSTFYVQFRQRFSKEMLTRTIGETRLGNRSFFTMRVPPARRLSSRQLNTTVRESPSCTRIAENALCMTRIKVNRRFYFSKATTTVFSSISIKRTAFTIQRRSGSLFTIKFPSGIGESRTARSTPGPR